MMKYYSISSSEKNGFYISSSQKEIDEDILEYLIGKYSTKLSNKDTYEEIGPLLNFRSPWCSNAQSIFQNCDINYINRIEKTIITNDSKFIYDKMTHMNYNDKDIEFKSPEPVDYEIIPFDKIGEYSEKMSLSLDQNDIKYYTNLFIKYGRNPTDIELYDLAQSNSEHSRHSFFNGKLLLDYESENSKTLMEWIKYPLKINKNNSTLAFCDNASAINGFTSTFLVNENEIGPSKIISKEYTYDISFTAETHNFPTSIAPFPGAATGTGGRIRDNQAIGRGGLTIAGTTGYCVGNLNIPHYILPWEDSPYKIDSLSKPLNILIDASNGASDYGNKFGEPVIQGFVRSFGNNLPSGDRIEWLKPIMFTGGIGMVLKSNLIKGAPEKEMVIIRLGGPAYRIGMGGGSASSRSYSEKDSVANFNAVQRGDPEMENKVNRVLKTCINMGENNPIISIHDQGAGGTANVTKEIVYPNGALIDINNIISGDESLSFLEKWVCEYQEQISILVYPASVDKIEKIAHRENCPISIIGNITDSNKIQVLDSSKNGEMKFPVDLNLEDVLGEIPQKQYKITKNSIESSHLKLPSDLSIMNALNYVLRLVSVGSKRFLTNKVDRSVTGLIAQQQCVGPLQTPLSNVATVAHSFFSLVGASTAIGEQPLKGIINSENMARMSIGEMLTNLMWSKISKFEDIKCSGNWMWPGKDPIEGYHLYNAVKTVSDTLTELGIAIDGGKDSMSMKVNSDDVVIKSPKSFVISGYAPCPNITKTITPDLKSESSDLFFIDLSNNYRIGGSALSQVFNQIGDDIPDLESSEILKHTFKSVQYMIDNNIILSGHDRSDGGLITCVIEMCISGDIGCDLKFINDYNPINYLFSEELGIVVESTDISLIEKFTDILPIYYIGRTNSNKNITVCFNDEEILSNTVENIRNLWEETSFELEKLQCNPECVKQEIQNIHKKPFYSCEKTIITSLENFEISEEYDFNVAIIRDEGSNGDSEMVASFKHAGFQVWDVNMKDLKDNPNFLDKFNGVAFVGGFSYSDVFGAAKGWAATIKFNKEIREQFNRFYQRDDTFSLGVCNGCQLMSLLGWIPDCKFVQNDSKRFESRFSTVKIGKSNSIMLKGMENSILGIWVAHAEGKYIGSDTHNAIYYVDNLGNSTQKYPFNPNGSEGGITGICSENGRHLAMMPHPERCFLKWQVPYTQPCLNSDSDYYPWFKIFVNAFEWCKQLKN